MVSSLMRDISEDVLFRVLLILLLTLQINFMNLSLRYTANLKKLLQRFIKMKSRDDTKQVLIHYCLHRSWNYKTNIFVSRMKLLPIFFFLKISYGYIIISQYWDKHRQLLLNMRFKHIHLFHFVPLFFHTHTQPADLFSHVLSGFTDNLEFLHLLWRFIKMKSVCHPGHFQHL